MRRSGHVRRGEQTAERNTNAGVPILFKLRRDIYLIPRSYQRDLRCISGTSLRAGMISFTLPACRVGNDPPGKENCIRVSLRERKIGRDGEQTFTIKEVTLSRLYFVFRAFEFFFFTDNFHRSTVRPQLLRQRGNTGTGKSVP